MFQRVNADNRASFRKLGKRKQVQHATEVAQHVRFVVAGNPAGEIEPVGHHFDCSVGLIRPVLSHLSFSSNFARRKVQYLSIKEFRCSSNGERNRPISAPPVTAPIRVCVYWIAASQRLVPRRCGLKRLFGRRSQLTAKGRPGAPDKFCSLKS